MKKLLRFVPFVILALTFMACNEKITDALLSNNPPRTFVSLFPDSDISKQQSRLTVHWWGDDSDGLVIGYYVTWDNVHWTFTTKNDSTFALKIGASDTNYVFKVAAVDNSGNGVYDNSVVQNGINFGPEPFIDQNGDGKYTPGEKFFDIGLIDPNPASMKYPIKNSAPTVSFNSLTVLPDTSYPIMTLGWDAEDIDGAETIVKVNIALNDTTKFVSLPGGTRLVMLRLKNFNSSDTQMEILLNASESNIYTEKLSGLKLNSNNRVYVQVEDISGAKSSFNELPSQSRNWYVKKPISNVLIIKDGKDADAPAFYRNTFNALKSGALANKYEVWDITSNKLPYDNVTFIETMKLFKYVYWYNTDYNPNLSIAGLVTRKFIDFGGKIAFSWTLPQTVDVTTLQSFLPVDSVGTVTSKDYVTTLFSNTNVASLSSAYPALKTTATVFRVRTLYPTSSNAVSIYNLETTQFSGNKTIGFRSSDKKLFFIALPLSKSDGNAGNVKLLLEKIFFEDFGLTL